MMFTSRLVGLQLQWLGPVVMFTSRLVGLQLQWLGPTIMFTSRLVGLQLQYGWVLLLCLPQDWLV